MKMTFLPALTVACALAFAGSAYAQRGHSPQPHAPKAPTTHVQSGAATHGGGATMHGGGTTAHGGGASVHGGGASTHGGSHGPTTSPKSTAHGSGAHAATKTRGATSTTSTATTTTTTTTASGTTTTSNTALTPLQQRLQKNTNLAAKLQTRLPNGVLVQDACVGFRNLGQFVAAVNVSNNLGIDFAQLKAKMTGTTLTGETIQGAKTLSLGQAIHELKPTVDADGEALTAQRQADALISAPGR